MKLLNKNIKNSRNSLLFTLLKESCYLKYHYQAFKLVSVSFKDYLTVLKGCATHDFSKRFPNLETVLSRSQKSEPCSLPLVAFWKISRLRKQAAGRCIYLDFDENWWKLLKTNFTTSQVTVFGSNFEVLKSWSNAQ